MYDARSEPHEFVGADRSEAVAKACQFFGGAEGDLVIAELDGEAVSGLSGRVVVVAIPKGVERRPGPRDEPPPRRGRSRGPGGPRGGAGPRGGGGRGGSRSERAAPERSAPERRPVEPRAESAPSVPSGPSVGTVRGEVTAVGEFVAGVIERLDQGPFEISETTEDDYVICQLRGEAVQELTSGDGRAVDALQLLANQAALRGSDESRRVILDAEGDPEAREGLLTRLAQRAAGRSRDSGRAIAMDPMNARDRRIIHVALRDAEGVATMSVGEGRYRQVVIVPEGAPEYEEAQQASAAAEARSSE